MLSMKKKGENKKAKKLDNSSESEISSDVVFI